MAKLSDRSEVTGGPLGTDEFHFIRSNGDSPETFSSFKASLSDLLGLATNLYDVPLSFSGTPDAGALIGKLIAVRDIDFPANFSGSVGHVGTNPDATFAIDVQDDGSTIGTISISTGGAFTFTTAGGTVKTIANGSRIEFYAPSNSPAEATIADIAATLKGTV
jgi:hypothetical protein